MQPPADSGTISCDYTSLNHWIWPDSLTFGASLHGLCNSH
jgi:hypothetical protein